MASDAVLSKMVILLLLVPLCTGIYGFVVSFFCNIGLSLLLCGCLCSVSLPRSAVGRSVVCDCSLSYTLVLFLMMTLTSNCHRCIGA